MEQGVRGKVYVLYSDNLLDENGEHMLYIGSTRSNSIRKRIRNHRTSHRRYLNGNYRWTTSFYLFEITNHPYFEILEEGVYTSLDALKGRENNWIAHYNGRTLNKRNSFLTYEETLENERNRYYNHKIYRCDVCNTRNMSKGHYNTHCKTSKHIRNMG